MSSPPIFTWQFGNLNLEQLSVITPCENTENEKHDAQQKKETKIDEKKVNNEENKKKEKQVNVEENKKELKPQPTDQKKQAHNNETNEKINQLTRTSHQN